MSLLPQIPVIDAGENWCLETLKQETERAHTLIGGASKRYPELLLKFGDRRSRNWLLKNNNPYLEEIDQVSDYMGRSGAHFLNVSYEWGCTSKAAPDPQCKSSRLIRVLDWPDKGLGSQIIALRIPNPHGEWISLTWPGYSGVLQAVAKGRFAIGLNQAPMESTTGIFLVDWLINRHRVWHNNFLPPSHLLRFVFENARNYEEAKHILTVTPVATSAIFIISGLTPDEACVIERRPEQSHILEGPNAAANSWQKLEWTGNSRGEDNENRASMMDKQLCCLEQDFSWLQAPVLNERTRLALIADASTGEIMAQGFEADGPATEILRL
ncbi:MAG: hypothetical protein ACRBBN_19790 [Methyloligellaceae bacterium]